MDCKTVRLLLDAPTLSAENKLKVEQHVEECPVCREDYSFYIRVTSESEDSPLHTMKLPAEYGDFSIADGVMARIWQENKWADPVKQKAGQLTKRKQRYLLFITVLLLVATLFPIIVNEGDNGSTSFAQSADGTTDTISSFDQLQLQNTESGHSKIKYGIVASVENPIIYQVEDTDKDFRVNYGLLTSLFGILVTVVSLSWLTRCKSN
ncbi:anti-sigma factor family protein [Aneurinibacillus terranovensis]|uniref:anti-sigma factor family protein n=1 Tax=Aneurinibacillus terranovensis TaxID=278991 RepID=UPI0003FF3935|nr:zf-HC2 domain-containing protein [Aneurinibacillus terranovensis]